VHSEPASGPSDAQPQGLLPFQRGNWYLLYKAGALARQRWNAMLAQLNLSPGQYGALMALDEAGQICQQRLAELIGVDPRNAVPIVDALAEQGLVSREIDRSDRRRRVLQLTPSGRAVTENLASVAAEIETDLLRPLTPGEQASLRRMLLALLHGTTNPPARSPDIPLERG
jgi:MarR family transcriptional regulator, temperature-dependent positive regulator of motility